MASYTLGEIAERLNITPPAEKDRVITGLSTLREAGATELSFLGTEKYAQQLVKTGAAAVLVSRKVKIPQNHSTVVMLVDDADLAMAAILDLFAPPPQRPDSGIDASARIHPSARIGEGARIAHAVTIGANVQIGTNCDIHPGVCIGDDVVVGENCIFYPNVVIRERVTIGNRVIINASSVIGTDGFGFRWDGTRHVKIPQIGTVVIEDDVEVGSCVCIDRAKLGATRIGRGTKFDNLVQIAHNVQIGPHCIIVAQVGIAGSSQLGAGVVLGGQTAVRDHLEIGDGAMSAACSGIADDVPARAVVSGLPALPHRQSLREQAHLRRLPELAVQIKKLQEKVDAMQSKE